MLVQLSCTDTQRCRHMCLQSCKTVASVAARQSCDPYEHPYGSWRSCGSRAIKCKLITRLSRGSLAAFAGEIHGFELLRSSYDLQQPCISCGRRASSLDRKKIAWKMNMLKI